MSKLVLIVAPAAVMLVLMGSSPARADLIGTVTSTVTPGVGGLFDYSYLVSNSATSTSGISDFQVAIDTTATASTLTEPTGFLSLYTPGNVSVEFASTDLSTDIAPGASATFTFVANAAPVSGSFQLEGFDDPSNPLLTFGGSTLTAGVVPEPSAMLLAAAGAFAFVVPRAVKRFGLRNRVKVKA